MQGNLKIAINLHGRTNSSSAPNLQFRPRNRSPKNNITVIVATMCG